ncbi:DUF5132 domain-containing protein [Paenibacillus cremeus]|uniref:DUF5132 domain-containing protein n=1 Tax=Paenibacillus cremeus TaxID=2163881 RepID=A0A559KE92_9BACL|nr:DUF5132 domain-containing protein [Paenibacillus cremeus]TVY10429.1 DUF5132 domain-containing protein [Paenibacillus cremeus]
MLDRQAEKWIVGAALAVAASTLVPILKSTWKPLVEDGVQTGSGLTDKIKYAVQVARDEIEDIVAEAQFERMKRRLDQEIASE